MRNCILWCEAKSAVTQHWQKDPYDKDIRHSRAETKWLKQINSIDSVRDQLEITEHVTDITYPVKKVRGHSRRSQVVHFNNLRTVVPGKAERMHGGNSCSVNSSHGEGRGKDGKCPLPGSSKAESTEPGMVISRADKEVVDVGANDDLPSEVVNVPGKRPEWISALPWGYSSSQRIRTWGWMWSGSRYIRYGGRWTCRRCLKKWDEWAGENRRRMWGRSWTANWTGPKTSMHEKTFKLLWWMDSKLMVYRRCWTT